MFSHLLGALTYITCSEEIAKMAGVGWEWATISQHGRLIRWHERGALGEASAQVVRPRRLWFARIEASHRAPSVWAAVRCVCKVWLEARGVEVDS